jgi:ATP-binding cassette subfamily B protein
VTGALLGPLGFVRACLVWLRPYRAQTALVGLTLLPAVAFCTVQPLLLKALVDDAVIPRDARRAAWLIGALALLLAVDAAMELVNYYLLARVGARVTNGLRARMLEHFQRLSLSFYDRAQLGALMARFTSDLDAIERALTRDLRAATVHALTVVVGLGVLFAIEWRLALLTLVFLPGDLSGATAAERPGGRRELRAAGGGRAAGRRGPGESLGAVVIKAFGLQSLLLGRLGGRLGRLAARTERVGLLAGMQASTISASGSGLLVTTIGWARSWPSGASSRSGRSSRSSS